MRNYRYHRRTNEVGLFGGMAAHVVHGDAPPAAAVQVGQRVWIDTSHVEDGFNHTPLSPTKKETDALQLGLRNAAHNIESADQTG